VVHSTNKILTGVRFWCPQRRQYEMAVFIKTVMHITVILKIKTFRRVRRIE